MLTNKQLLSHHKLALTLFLFILATIPLFVWAVTQPSRTLTRAYFPGNCKAPLIPRGKICSTQWTITRDDSGCRIFTCEDKTSKLP